MRSILQANLAPNLLRELASRTPTLVNHLRGVTEKNMILAVLSLFDDLASLSPTWISQNGYVIDAVIELWRFNLPSSDQLPAVITEVIHKSRYSLMLAIFTTALKQSPRIDLLFDITSVYTFDPGIDIIGTTKLLYEHVAMNEDGIFRRNILMRFLTWFADSSHTWTQKAYFVRYIVTPILFIHATRSKQATNLINSDFINQVHRMIWQPTNDAAIFSETDDMFKIEMLHLTTI